MRSLSRRPFGYCAFSPADRHRVVAGKFNCYGWTDHDVPSYANWREEYERRSSKIRSYMSRQRYARKGGYSTTVSWQNFAQDQKRQISKSGRRKSYCLARAATDDCFRSS